MRDQKCEPGAKKAITALDVVKLVSLETKQLKQIIFDLYNGGMVRAELVNLYQDIGEGSVVL